MHEGHYRWNEKNDNSKLFWMKKITNIRAWIIRPRPTSERPRQHEVVQKTNFLPTCTTCFVISSLEKVDGISVNFSIYDRPDNQLVHFILSGRARPKRAQDGSSGRKPIILIRIWPTRPEACKRYAIYLISNKRINEMHVCCGCG